jgi:hypothetical protein
VGSVFAVGRPPSRSFNERVFRIRDWKDRLPDAARWFGGGFAEGRLAGTKADYLRRSIRQTWRGELCHGAAMACAPLVVCGIRGGAM